MMDATEIYHATKDAFIDAHREISHPLVIPLSPFRAERMLADGDTDPAHVTGIRFDSVKGEWLFVCLVSDGTGSIYVTEEDSLEGDIPPLETTK